MPFGILEDHTLEHVPGTVLLETLNHVVNTTDTTGPHELKRGTGRHSHIVLVPQPSEDLNDPLNWPLWQRDVIFIIYCYCTILVVGSIGPLLSSSAFILLEEFHVGFADISLLTGYNLIAVGAMGIFMSAACRKYGKRPGFLFSMICAFGGTIWGGTATSYNSLVGARVLQGLGISAFESVMYAVVGDLYFVHERGIRTALFTTCLSGLARLPAMLAGHLAVVETKDLPPTCEEDVSSPQTPVSADGSPRPRKSLVQRMAIYSGTYTEESFVTLIVRPFIVLLNPAAIWAVLTMAFTTLWYVVISFVVAQVFASPPYLLDSAHVGYLSAGPVVGGTLGCIVCALISDPIIRWLARKNDGVYEPEFRLVLIIGVLVPSAIGFFLFGNLAGEGKSPTSVSVAWGVAVVAPQFMSVVVGTYIVDAYRSLAQEIFIIAMVLKNFLFFGFSYFMNDWVANWGVARVFDCIGGVEIAICALSLPMWFFGKRLRAFIYKHHVMEKLKL
ncbi:hypothetical protein LTS06_010633 [Exophiala xenobiotica]|nr:hypothetical protein LTS06_010633 [Exophiala xenobiotica]KAK5348341.1 hypothetical protein LTR61_007800 [Exophiala xenobiotica]